MIRLWLKELRFHQWTKNLLIPAVWLFATFDASQAEMALGWRPLVLMLGMFGSFCLISSAFYLFNDLRDREADRQHPVKRNRPIAAGLIAPRRAASVSALLLGLGFVPSLVMFARHVDRWGMMVVLLGYSAMQFAYSYGLKRVPYLDVVIIAAGFVLRAIAGTTVLGIRFSPWLFACAFSLALFLALCKRRHEKVLSEQSRAALAGYRLPTLEVWVILAAFVTLALYTAYTLAPETVARYHCDVSLVWTAIPVALGLVRYLYLTYSQADVGRPEKILLTDRVLWVVLALYAVTTLMILLSGLD